MKKIKKISKLTLNDEQMSKIMGGDSSCDYDMCNVSSIDRSTPWHPEPDEGYEDKEDEWCKCGCGFCPYEDGGTGFMVGMIITKNDGPY